MEELSSTENKHRIRAPVLQRHRDALQHRPAGLPRQLHRADVQVPARRALRDPGRRRARGAEGGPEPATAAISQPGRRDARLRCRSTSTTSRSGTIANTRMFIAGFVLLLVLVGLGADGDPLRRAASRRACRSRPSAPCASAASRPGGRSRAATGPSSTRRAPSRSTGPIRRTACSTTWSRRWRSPAGLPKPAIYVIPDSDPNAFATGIGPERASIAVTRGPAREARPGRAAGRRRPTSCRTSATTTCG